MKLRIKKRNMDEAWEFFNKFIKSDKPSEDDQRQEDFFRQKDTRESTLEYNKFLKDSFDNFKRVSTIEKESPYQILLALRDKPKIFASLERKIQVFNSACTLYDFYLYSFCKDVMDHGAPAKENRAQTREVLEKINAIRNLQTLYGRITGGMQKKAMDEFFYGYKRPQGQNILQSIVDKPKEYMQEIQFKIPDAHISEIEKKLNRNVHEALLLITTNHDLMVQIGKPLESGLGYTDISGQRKIPVPPPPAPQDKLAKAALATAGPPPKIIKPGNADVTK